MFAFADCTSLVNISIPEGVTSIGKYAFYKCNNLTGIIFENISGWFISDSDTAVSGTNISVNDAMLNAVYFKYNYCKFHWKRA